MATQHLILPRRKVSSGDDIAPSPRPVTTPMPNDFLIPTIPDLPGGLGQDAVFNRQEQLVQALEVWNRGLSPDVRKKKYAKMKYAASDKGMEPSPFAVYRATDHLFWQDLSHDARLHLFGNTKTHTWLSGDCHCCNFGSFHNRKGETVYALNDFDESLVADYQMDLWRLAVSILLAMNQVGVANSEKDARDIIRTLGRSYRASAVEHRAEKGAIFTSLNTTGRLQAFLRAVEGSKKFRYKKLFKKWTEDGRAERFDLVSNSEKLHRCQPAEADIVRKALEGQYAQRLGLRIRVRDVAQRLYQGLGAFGLKRFYAIVDLLDEGERDMGNGERQTGGEHSGGAQTRGNGGEQNGGDVGADDDEGGKDGNNYKGRIILDVKLQPQASAYHFMRLDERVAFRKRYENDAKRTADAAKVLMSDADPYLGWIEITADDAESFVGWTDGFYSVREISPKKSSYPVLPADAKGPLKELALKDTEGFKEMAEQWGRVLAVSHAQAAAALEGKTEGRPAFSIELERLTAGESMEEFEDLLSGVVSHHAKLVAEDYDTFAKYVYPDPPEVEQPVGSDDEA